MLNHISGALKLRRVILVGKREVSTSHSAERIQTLMRPHCDNAHSRRKQSIVMHWAKKQMYSAIPAFPSVCEHNCRFV